MFRTWLFSTRRGGVSSRDGVCVYCVLCSEHGCSRVDGRFIMLTMTDSEQRAESLRGTDWVNQGLCTSRPATIPKVTFRISRPAANREQTLAHIHRGSCGGLEHLAVTDLRGQRSGVACAEAPGLHSQAPLVALLSESYRVRLQSNSIGNGALTCHADPCAVPDGRPSVCPCRATIRSRLY